MGIRKVTMRMGEFLEEWGSISGSKDCILDCF